MPAWVSILIKIIIAIAQIFDRQPSLGAHPEKLDRYSKRQDQYKRILDITREK